MAIVATTALPVLFFAPNMKSLLKTFERAPARAPNGPNEAATTFERELANSSHSDTAATREIVWMQ